MTPNEPETEELVGHEFSEEGDRRAAVSCTLFNSTVRARIVFGAVKLAAKRRESSTVEWRQI